MPSNKVFDRAMFQASNQPLKADSGIMQGFDEQEDEFEVPEDEMLDELSKRKPNSPEILMNNLRGDMRSVDARYQELAEMVGEEAAMDTPPEVLALLQAQMAQQPMGIGALPAQGMTPPPSMPPAAPMPTPDMMGGMPQGMPQEPQNFAQGGMVGVPGYALGGFASRIASGIARADGSTPSSGSGGGIGGIIGRAVSQILAKKKAEQAPVTPAVPTQTVRPATPNVSTLVASPMYGRPMQPLAQQQQPMQMPMFPTGPMATQQPYNYNPYNFGQPRAFADGGEVYYPPAENVYSKYSNFPEGVAAAGRNGDTMLAHITPEQEAYLTMLGDGKTINPHTGLPEHFLGMGNLAARGGSALYNMGANLGQRAIPYLQAADAYAGRALFNPVLTAPTVSQSRSTLGTFGPKVVEGMELVYPTLTQRVGQVAAPVVERIAQTPAAAKIGAGMAAIPGAAFIREKMGGGAPTPNMPSSDVPGAIVTDGQGGRSYVMPEAPEEEAPQATPIDYSRLPVTTTAAPATETETKPTTEQFIKDSLAKKPTESRLEAYMEQNLPIFEKYLGGDKDYAQSQALFLLADAGLELATKRGRTGAMSIANAFKKVPAGLSSINAQEEQARRAVRGAALTAGLQTIAAEDKETALTQRKLIEVLKESGKTDTVDLGAGRTLFKKKGTGEPITITVDKNVTDSFLQSQFTPQIVKDQEGNITGFDTPYARSFPKSQTIQPDKETAVRLAGEISRQELALSKLDEAIQYYTDAFGPKAFFSNLKNNVLVPVTPLDPNLMTEKQRTKINLAMNTAVKAIARAGDSNNIAVAEQRAAKDLLGDEPGKFFSDYETALQRIMTVRTDLANQRLNTAAQLGWINQGIQLEVPNIGTRTDPIPQEKMPYLRQLAKSNPNGRVYVRYGKTVEEAPLSSFTE